MRGKNRMAVRIKADIEKLSQKVAELKENLKRELDLPDYAFRNV